MKNLKIKTYHFILSLFFLLFVCGKTVNAEGTKQLKPTASDNGAVQIYDNNSIARSFATYSAPAEKRLYIHVSNPTNEKIYMGFKQPDNDVYFRLKDPNGAIVMGPTLVPSSGNGFINSYSEAVAGPSALATGGYAALTYQPLLSGDYYIEFSPKNATTPVIIKRVFDLLDITVANKTSNTPILGRLWSKIWDLTTYSFANTFAASYFIYSTDSLVTKVGFNGIKPYGFNIFCNQTGCANTGNLIDDRKSRTSEYGVPQYKLFLNDPDNAAYPSGSTQNTNFNTSITGCQSTGYCINVSSNKMGSIEIVLDLNGIAGFQSGTTDVLLGTTIQPGVTCVPWNGKDGLGNFVPVGTTFNAITKFIGGLTNLPMFDVEGHPNGFTMSIVRPAAAAGTTPKLYWDDSNLSSGTSNYNGANSPAHAWIGNDQGAGFGDVRTMNTWWYSYDKLQTVTYTIKSTCPPDANDDNTSMCSGASKVISILANDIATSGSTLNTSSVVVFQLPVNGTVQVNASGNVTYTPNAGFFGNDFFIYTVKDSYGNTSNTATVSISVNPSPQVQANGGVVTCKRDETSVTLSATSNVSNATYAWTGANFSSIAQNPQVSTGGTYTVLVTNPTTGCSASASAVVNQNTLAPTATASGGHLTCAIPSVVLQSASNTSNVNYNWTGPNGFASLLQNPIAVAPGTYTVVVVNPMNECYSNATAIVTGDFVQPEIVATGGHITCGRTSNTVTLVASSNSANSVYTWMGPNNFSATTFNAVVSYPGNYTVSVSNPINGCSAIANAVVTGPLSMNLITSKVDAVCQGSGSGSASVLVTGGTAPFTYQWNTNPSQTTSSAINLKAGTYTVVVTDADECPISASVTVNEPSEITGTTSSIAPTCANGNNGSASVVVSGGTAPYTYSWNTTTPQFSSTASGLSSDSYILYVSDANQCQSQWSVVVPITNAVPAAVSIQGNTTFCEGESVQLTANPAAGYMWNNGATTQSVTVNSSGDYTVTLTNALGCIAQSASIAIIVNPNPQVQASGGIITCKRDETSATLSATSNVSNASYSWTGTNFSSIAQNPQVSTGGTYNVLVTNPTNGCSASASAVVNQNTLAPTATASGGHLTCAIPSVTLQSASNTSNVNYNWTGPNGFTSLLQNPIAVAPGTYTVVVVNPINECYSNAVALVTASLELPLVTVSGGHISCKREEDSLQLAANSNLLNAAYSWTGPNGFVSLLQHPIVSVAGTYSVSITDPSNGCTSVESAFVSGPIAMTLSTSTLPVLCAGAANGSASVMVQGGTAPFTYQWTTSVAQTTPTASQLAAGTYAVIVTDSDECSVSASAEIVEPTSLMATNQLLVPVTCRGGSDGQAGCTIVGGTAPYSFSWSTNSGATTSHHSGLKSGTYKLFVTDANGCTNNWSFGITQPSAIVVTKTIQPISCNGAANGSISISNISGGTAPYTFSWNVGIAPTASTLTNLAPGQYGLTVLDANGCSLTMNYSITQPQVLGTKTTLLNVTCNGDNSGEASVTGIGGTAPYTYSWDTNPSQNTNKVVNLKAGIYTVFITDARGCSVSKRVTISQPKALLTKYTSTPVSCRNEDDASISLGASGGTAPYSFSWNTAETSSSIINLVPGTYTYVVTDAAGCTKTGSILIAACSGFTAEPDTMGIIKNNEISSSIYPNPTLGNTNVDILVYSDTRLLLVQVYKPDGLLLTTLYNGPATANTPYAFSFNASALQPGVYMVHIQTSSMTIVRRLIVQ